MGAEEHTATRLKMEAKKDTTTKSETKLKSLNLPTDDYAIFVSDPMYPRIYYKW